MQEAQVTRRGLPHDVQDFIQVVSLGFLNHQQYLAGGLKHFAVSPPGEDDPNLTVAYFSDGLKPSGPTGQLPGLN